MFSFSLIFNVLSGALVLSTERLLLSFLPFGSNLNEPTQITQTRGPRPHGSRLSCARPRVDTPLPWEAYDPEGSRSFGIGSDYQYLEQSCGIAGHALSAALAVRPH